MEYAHISAKFPEDLDKEIEQLLEETGIYTNKSEFVRTACREHLERLHEEPAITAIRLERLLAQAEDSRIEEDAVSDRLEELRDKISGEGLSQAVDASRKETDQILHDSS
jgi:antitoxin ParD1/3/4